MAKIVFEEPDGKEHTVDIANGQSIMEGAVKDAVAGIDADCGGACSCATCMVYVPEEGLRPPPAQGLTGNPELRIFPHRAAKPPPAFPNPVHSAPHGFPPEV